MYAIKTEKLTKKYKEKTAVSDLDLKINEGEMYGLLGVNGAGKTTTMKMLTTLIMPTSGEAELLGHSIKTDRAAVKQIIGISPQESAAAMNLTARENLELMAEVYGFSKKVAKAKASELIERFSMREFENRKAKRLSGGEVRRLSIAMALISEPKILFLDEPTLGLDVIARHSLWVEIEKLKGKITVILTTHYLEEAVALCDRIGIMAHGKFVAEGTSADILFRTRISRCTSSFVVGNQYGNPRTGSDDNVQHRQADARYYGFRNELYLPVLVNAHCKGQNNKLYDEIVHISAQSTRVYYRIHTSAFANGNFAECRMRCCCVLPRT